MKWIRVISLALLCLVLLVFSTGCPKSETQTQDTTDTTAPTAPTNLIKASPGNDNTPTFTWSAASDADSGVAYYLGRIDSESFVDIGSVTTYTALDALSEGDHTFAVKAVDNSGNQGTAAILNFLCTSPDTAPPTMSSISVSGITTSSAIVAWTTSENATSQVEYGTTVSYGSSSVLDSSLVTTHSVNLAGLTAGTTYHYRVKSVDSSSNQATSGDNTFATTGSASGQLAVYFIDVGQGDAILIDYGTYEMLIDGGTGATNVASYIKPYVDGPLDVVVATHPDADHIGGLIAVLNSFTVEQIWTDGQATTTQTYAQFTGAVATAQANGAQVYTGRRGNTIDLGGLTFHVLNPTDTNGTTNNDSIVLELDFGHVDFLFEGDAEQEAEASMIAAGLIHHVDIVKIGHHGSDTASSAAFVAATSPEVAVYCCGLGNQYGHPAASTVAEWQNVGAAVYGTDVNATIAVTTDGATYHVVPTNGGSLPTGSTGMSLQILSVTSPVSRGGSATLSAQTVPGAQCTISVNYQSGPSQAQGLEPKTADSSGNVSWTWKVGTNTATGSWPITVTASLGGKTASQTTHFAVQ